MDQAIIFPNPELKGGISIIRPFRDCGLSIDEIARKDVPQGLPYLLLDANAIPADRTFRDAWEADFSTPDGHGDPNGYWADIQSAEASK